MRRLRGSSGPERLLPPAAGEPDPPAGAAGAVPSALVAAPAFVSFVFLVNLAFTRAGCDMVPAAVRILLPLGAAVFAAWALVNAVRIRTLLGGNPTFVPSAAVDRSRFLAIASIAAAAASLLGALYIAAVAIVLEPCWYR